MEKFTLLSLSPSLSPALLPSLPPSQGYCSELPKNGDEWHHIRDGHLPSLEHCTPAFNSLLLVRTHQYNHGLEIHLCFHIEQVLYNWVSGASPSGVPNSGDCLFLVMSFLVMPQVILQSLQLQYYA